MSNKLWISAGHHIKDPGAIGNNRTESHMMMTFRNIFTNVLDCEGVKYKTDKDTETLSQYLNRLELTKDSIILDFHMNSSVPRKDGTLPSGVEVIVSNNAGSKSKEIAKRLVDGYARILGIPNRGVKTEAQTNRGKLGILNKRGSAVLVEFGFINNLVDVLAFEKNQIALAKFTREVLNDYI